MNSLANCSRRFFAREEPRDKATRVMAVQAHSRTAATVALSKTIPGRVVRTMRSINQSNGETKVWNKKQMEILKKNVMWRSGLESVNN